MQKRLVDLMMKAFACLGVLLLAACFLSLGLTKQKIAAYIDTDVLELGVRLAVVIALFLGTVIWMVVWSLPNHIKNKRCRTIYRHFSGIFRMGQAAFRLPKDTELDPSRGFKLDQPVCGNHMVKIQVFGSDVVCSVCKKKICDTPVSGFQQACMDKYRKDVEELLKGRYYA